MSVLKENIYKCIYKNTYNTHIHYIICFVLFQLCGKKCIRCISYLYIHSYSADPRFYFNDHCCSKNDFKGDFFSVFTTINYCTLRQYVEYFLEQNQF